MQTILVTGGAGFIGGCFVRKMIAEQRWRIINLDKLTYAGNLDSLASVEGHPDYTFARGDIGDIKLVSQLLAKHRPSAIVNFAAESHVDRSIDSPAEFLQTNVLGTVRLLEATRDYWKELSADEQQSFRFLHVSTDEVYGTLGAEGLFTETTPYSPNSPYAASKAASDHFVRAFQETYGVPTLITNCSNNYGPFQFPEKLIPLMILNAIEGRPLPVYGDGQNVRDWLHVEDHCDAIRTVLENGQPGDDFNIGGNSERTNIEVVERIADLVDRHYPDLGHSPCRSLIRFVTDRPGHDRRYAIDATKIRERLGWEPKHTFESGLEDTVKWFIENTYWVHRVTSGSYRRERLGLNESATAREKTRANN